MLKLNSVLRQLKIFKTASYNFARLNNTRLNKSVLLNSNNNSTINPNKNEEENKINKFETE